MSQTSREINASSQRVFEVLADGWLYPTWVVGAARIRAVDHTWPAAGSRLHHSVGVWPGLINDETRVEEVDPPRVLQLRARAWPSGEARIRIEIEPIDARSKVTITERVVAGPARLIPTPLEDRLLHWRNAETLDRLAFLAERRTEP